MYPFCTRVGLDLRRRGRDALPAGTPMRRAGRESMKSVRAGADGVGDDARPNGVGWLFAPNTPMHAPAAMTGPPPRGRLWRCPGATWTSPATPPRVRTTPIVLNVAWRLSSLSERFTHDDDAVFAGRAAGHLDASALRRRYTAALRRGASPATLSSSWAFLSWNAPLPACEEPGGRRDVVGVKVFFRAVSVSDVEQIAPLGGLQPTPLEPRCEPLDGSRTSTLQLAHRVMVAATVAGSIGCRSA
jgi:hypothetical protein